MVAVVVLPADKVFVFITALAVIGNRVNLVDVSAVKVGGVVSEEFEVGWGHIARENGAILVLEGVGSTSVAPDNGEGAKPERIRFLGAFNILKHDGGALRVGRCDGMTVDVENGSTFLGDDALVVSYRWPDYVGNVGKLIETIPSGHEVGDRFAEILELGEGATVHQHKWGGA
jgi:hypothetical protein